ncbi:hypothetical protein SteCoe_27925 [Stentor coeruleus]|uniref:IgGFc-binding protein N-terminal domain-containing protein n=1 Tax=Stentor coeruleus TaxID=5963 RepID=A0A1R2B9E8_9CILI|nr:hypothetical protein SteCoe_27925 [Stentor coeruleus]
MRIFLCLVGILVMGEVTELIESTQLLGSISQSESWYYWAKVNPSKTLDIAVQPIFGDTDLFLDIVSENPTALPMPNMTHHQFASESPIVLESIHLTTKSFEKCKGDCYIKASVLCLSSSCSFYIYYDQDSYIILSENRPIQSHTEKETFTYFRFYLAEDSNLFILLTVIGNSNPDLYVSKNTLPTKQSADWKSETFGGETLSIYQTESGVYYIGIFCQTKSEFTIMISTEIYSFLQLYPGLPQYMEIPEKNRNLFVFWSSSKEDIEIKISLLKGQVVLMANPQHPEIEEMAEKIPTPTDRAWASLTKDNEENIIVIKASDKNFCNNCNIIISVAAYYDSEYIITVNNAQYLEVLLNGVPVQGVVEKNTINSYMFTLDTASDIEFRLASYVGDADIYVSRSIPVSDWFYDWKSSQSITEESLVISVSDKNWICGTYYIAIVATQTSSYSLVVFAELSPVIIVPGWSQLYSVENPMHFYLNVIENIPYTCTLTPFNQHFKPDIYINTNGIMPDKKNYEIAVQESDYDPILGILEIDVLYTEPKIIGISVYGTASFGQPFFSLVCMSSLSIMKLFEKDYVYMKLNGETLDFELVIYTENDVLITLQPCFGNPKMRISQDPELYFPDPNVVVIESFNKIEGKISKPKGRYYVRVYGNIDDSFELFTSHKNSFTMTPGGEITYKETSSGYKVSWPRVVVNNGDADISVLYYVYYNISFSETFYRSCGLRLMEKFHNSGVVLETSETSIEIKTKKSQVLNVMAVFGRHRFETQGYAVYDPIKLENNDSSSETESSYWWVYVLIIAGIGGAGYGYYNYRKRRTTVRLSNSDYELSSF